MIPLIIATLTVCEVVTMWGCSAIPLACNRLRMYPSIRSKLPILKLADNKAVMEAAEIIQQGKYIASSRMNWFLTSINKIPFTLKHLSWNYSLNTGVFYKSRHTSSCVAQSCSKHKFTGCSNIGIGLSFLVCTTNSAARWHSFNP